MANRTVTLKLDGVANTLIRVVEKLRWAVIELHQGAHTRGEYSDYIARDMGCAIALIGYQLLGTAQHAKRLSYDSSKIVEAAELILKNSSHFQPTLKDEVFHYFPRLPVELQDMIWAEAAQRPPCKHHFTVLMPILGEEDLLRPYVNIQGLWAACRASHLAMVHAYQRERTCYRTEVCKPQRKLIKAQLNRISTFEADASHFKAAVRVLNNSTKVDMFTLADRLCGFGFNHDHFYGATRDLYEVDTATLFYNGVMSTTNIRGKIRVEDIF